MLLIEKFALNKKFKETYKLSRVPVAGDRSTLASLVVHVLATVTVTLLLLESGFVHNVPLDTLGLVSHFDDLQIAQNIHSEIKTQVNIYSLKFKKKKYSLMYIFGKYIQHYFV